MFPKRSEIRSPKLAVRTFRTKSSVTSKSGVTLKGKQTSPRQQAHPGPRVSRYTGALGRIRIYMQTAFDGKTYVCMTRSKTASGSRVTLVVGSLGSWDGVTLGEMSKKTPYKHFRPGQLSATSWRYGVVFVAVSSLSFLPISPMNNLIWKKILWKSCPVVDVH